MMKTTLLRRAAACLMVALLGCSAAADRGGQPLSEAEVIALGHRYTRWFYAHQLDSLITRFADPDYTLERLRSFRAEVQRNLGEETEVLNERIHIAPADRNHHAFVRHSRFAKVEPAIKTSFGFDGRGRIFEFTVEGAPAEAPTRFLDYETLTPLRLPFAAAWTVAAGGRASYLNHHAVAVDQRFAYDFLIRRAGRTFRTDGRRNEDYHCYELEILAPGAGTVVDVVNDIPENRLGDMPPTSGNRVIIDHGNGEFSVLAHFKRGTVVVAPGQHVESGQLLGLCGNSGHSSEPHLHYHLQNSPEMFAGEGLPAQLLSYLADGQTVERGEPVCGQKVRHVPR